VTIGAQDFNLNNVNNTVGNWAKQLKTMFAQAPILQGELNALGLAGLEAAPWSLSATDAQNLLNCVNDIVNLASVYAGNSYVAFGATVNTGVVTANSASHFGYNFDLTIGSKAAGIGF
jgi:hypothetical protein